MEGILREPGRPRRILFLTTKYPLPGDSYLIGELAEALAAMGHKVDVLHLSWDAAIGSGDVERAGPNGMRIVDLAPRAKGRPGSLLYKASKFLLTSRAATKQLRRHFDVASYDALVAYTPALTLAGPLRAAIRAGVRTRILYVFDFFPIHHREIGLIPSGLVYAAAKGLEEWLIRSFTTIVCNLPGNIGYLRRNFDLRRDQRVVSTPLWTVTAPLSPEPREAVRKELELPLDRPIAIFGGQLTQGRGIEQMLDAAELAEQRGSPLMFLFVGGGRLADDIAARAGRSSNVRHVPTVQRDRYLSVVSACDVGMVATVRGVSSFSFPTKTIDYLRAGLPVVAAVEPGSDYTDILTGYDVGRSVAFDDAGGYLAALEALTAPDLDRAALRVRADRALDEVFDVRHSARTVLEAIAAEEAKEDNR